MNSRKFGAKIVILQCIERRSYGVGKRAQRKTFCSHSPFTLSSFQGWRPWCPILLTTLYLIEIGMRWASRWAIEGGKNGGMASSPSLEPDYKFSRHLRPLGSFLEPSWGKARRSHQGYFLSSPASFFCCNLFSSFINLSRAKQKQRPAVQQPSVVTSFMRAIAKLRSQSYHYWFMFLRFILNISLAFALLRFQDEIHSTPVKCIYVQRA